MVDIEGTRLDADTAAFLRQHQIRAVCLFRKNLGTEDEIRQLTTDLRAAMGEHALIGIDQEGGSGHPLHDLAAGTCRHGPGRLCRCRADHPRRCRRGTRPA